MADSDNGVFGDLEDASEQGVGAAALAREHSEASSSNSKSGAADEGEEEIELCRRVVPVLEVDEDVCSICLDEFTEEDPGKLTTCHHQYHLQCVMLWAQRSRTCPLCFKQLRLQDEALNELLPFGEYVPPEQCGTGGLPLLVGLESWDLERLLARLAAANAGLPSANGRRQRARATQQHAASGATATSAARDIGTSQAASATLPRASIPNDAQHCADAPASGSRDQYSAAGGDPAASYPSSWPPATGQHDWAAASTSRPRRGQSSGAEVGASLSLARSSGSASLENQLKAAGESLRARWAAAGVRARESLSKTTRELRARWSRSSGSLPTSPAAAASRPGAS